MKRELLCVVFVLAMFPLLARSAEAPSTKPQTFTGTLRGGDVAVGGETTGWLLEGDGATGAIQLDVSKVKAEAEKLQGKRVSVEGNMTEKEGPEQGKRHVLVVERISVAAEKKDSK